jgi:hypothetical protein
VSDAVKKFGALKGDKLEVQEIPLPGGLSNNVPLIPPSSFLKALETIIEGLRHPDLNGTNYWGAITWVGLTTRADETIAWIDTSAGKTDRRHEYGFRKAYFSAPETHIQESRIHATVFLKIAELLGIAPRAAKDKKGTARLGGTSEPYSKAKALTGADNTSALQSTHLNGTTEKEREQSVPSASPPPQKNNPPIGGRRICKSPLLQHDLSSLMPPVS